MKTLILTMIILGFVQAAFAQTSRDEYRRFELYAGYNHNRFDFNQGSTPVFTVPDGVPAVFGRGGLQGFDVSGTYNVSRYLGIKGLVTTSYGTDTFSDRYPIPCREEDPTCEPLQCRPGDMRPECLCLVALTCPDNPVSFKRKSSLYEFVGGVQLKDNSVQTRIKPFAHVLAGGARIASRFYPNPDDPNPPLCAACGAFTLTRVGFSLSVGGGLDVRLGRRFDLRVAQIDYNPTRFGGRTQHNLRFSTGLVVH